MTSKKPSPSASFNVNINNTTSSESSTCKVCGDKASMKYYGAMSCQPCKTFFRRNVSRGELIRPCADHHQCEVNLLTRNICASCRLAKCFAVGMSADRIRKEMLHGRKYLPKVKLNKTQELDCKPADQSGVLNLLNDDASALNASDWLLFSNVVHACDVYSLVPALRHMLERSTSPYRDDQHCPEEDILMTLNSMYTSLQSLISCIPDFQMLSVDEQRSLLKRNMHGLGGSYTALMIRDSRFLENFECVRRYEIAYGPEMLQETNRLLTRLDIDSNLLKMMLIITMFSTNCFTVDMDIHMPTDRLTLGTFRLYRSQNTYVELLWKYMAHQFGDQETIRRFAGLVKSVLDALQHSASIYKSNTAYHAVVDEIITKTQKCLVLNHETPVALWGKTLPSS